MTGYFGALLRSAGSPPARMMPPTAPFQARASASGVQATELVEQDVEVETSTMPAPPPTSHPPRQAVAGLSRPDDRATPSAPQDEPQMSEPASPGPSDSGHEASPPLISRLAEGEVHPAVRAAMQWVAADPALRARPEVGVDVREERTIAGLPVGPDSTEPAHLAAPSSRRDRSAEPGEALEPRAPRDATPPEDRAAGELDLTVRPERRISRGRAADIERDPHTRRDHVEVHIGTIHVAVDAPSAPRPAVQPPSPPQRPPARPASRSSFGRSRLPRL